ncbi:hypothetical protein [Corynebacterium sp. UBA2622]|uniref:hypothetical protein n=1 Tax=Corynebacterium sp. UBA2622 TaxID=1946393 RepID=UPI0025B9A993|nr:hypothetical protein [Corynebacterium sp. UBA2622]
MTIVTRNNVPASVSRALPSPAVAPAVVWDLPARSLHTCGSGVVRSLGAAERTRARSNISPDSPRAALSDPREARHETRASLMMGAALGLALLIGSAVGGVYSAGGTGAQHQGDVTREVVTAQVG